MFINLIADKEDGDVFDSLLSARFRDDGNTSTADWNRSGEESASTIVERLRQQAAGSSFERTNFWQNMSGGNRNLIYIFSSLL